jgi:hypothetical protein
VAPTALALAALALAAACADPAPGLYLELHAPAGATFDRVELFVTTGASTDGPAPHSPGWTSGAGNNPTVWIRDFTATDVIDVGGARGSYTVRLTAPAAPTSAPAPALLPYGVVVGYVADGAGGERPVGVAELPSATIPSDAVHVFPVTLDAAPVAAKTLEVWGRKASEAGSCLRWTRTPSPAFIVRAGDTDCDAMLGGSAATPTTRDCDDLVYCDPTQPAGCASRSTHLCLDAAQSGCALDACVNTEVGGVVARSQQCGAASTFCLPYPELCGGMTCGLDTPADRLRCALESAPVDQCLVPVTKVSLGGTPGLLCTGGGVTFPNPGNWNGANVVTGNADVTFNDPVIEVRPHATGVVFATTDVALEFFRDNLAVGLVHLQLDPANPDAGCAPPLLPCTLMTRPTCP